MELYDNRFLWIDSYVRLAAVVCLGILTFVLTFAVLPFAEWRLHFFQFGIFITSFLFGPLAGAAVGALSSSYNGLFVISNPWIIGGNAILGLGAAYLYTKTTPFKAAMGAFAIQLPYLVVTDMFLMDMPLQIVLGILGTLLISNIVCASVAAKLTPRLRAILAASR